MIASGFLDHERNFKHLLFIDFIFQYMNFSMNLLLVYT